MSYRNINVPYTHIMSLLYSKLLLLHVLVIQPPCRRNELYTLQIKNDYFHSRSVGWINKCSNIWQLSVREIRFTWWWLYNQNLNGEIRSNDNQNTRLCVLQWSYVTDYVSNCTVKDETQFEVSEFVPHLSKLTQDKLYGASSSDGYDTACIACMTRHDTSCITYTRGVQKTTELFK
jgi:hypothetical protein